MIAKNRPQRREMGLTLLEVLAAVMIFAMVMTVLIGTSSNAVHHVGVSSRRLEADLVADSLLSDLEIQIKQGTAPSIEDGEFTSEQYSIRMTMTHIMPTNPGAGFAPAVALAGRGDALALLGSSLPEVAKHLKQYDIEVSWLEQTGPQSVLRTTFAFDWDAAQGDIASLIEDGAADNGISGLDGSGADRPGAKEMRARQPRTSFNGHNARENQLNGQPPPRGDPTNQLNNRRPPGADR